MNDIIESSSPIGAGLPAESGMNHSVTTIESRRAVAEALGQIQIAKTFPRSEMRAVAMLKESCKIPEFASAAFYAVPNRGSGPSIRFAEEAARVYGNFTYGHRELERSKGRSLVEVFAWDIENNNRSTRQITVEHVVDTKNGPKKLTDQADIDNRIANVASKQMRGRILALLPKSLVMIGIAEAKKTISGNNTLPMAQRIQRVIDLFARISVSTKHLEAYIGHSMDAVTEDEFADLQGVFNAIKEGAKASEYFDLGGNEQAQGQTLAAALEKAPAAEQAPAPAARTTTRRTTTQAQAKPRETPAEAQEPATQAQATASAPAPAPAPEPDTKHDGSRSQSAPPDDDDQPPMDEDMF